MERSPGTGGGEGFRLDVRILISSCTCSTFQFASFNAVTSPSGAVLWRRSFRSGDKVTAADAASTAAFRARGVLPALAVRLWFREHLLRDAYA